MKVTLITCIKLVVEISVKLCSIHKQHTYANQRILEAFLTPLKNLISRIRALLLQLSTPQRSYHLPRLRLLHSKTQVK